MRALTEIQPSDTYMRLQNTSAYRCLKIWSPLVSIQRSIKMKGKQCKEWNKEKKNIVKRNKFEQPRRKIKMRLDKERVKQQKKENERL